MTHRSQIIDFHSAADTTAAARPAQDEQARLDYALLAVDAFKARTRRPRGCA
jgi:hypothetical protein